METVDPYEILGVSKDASKDEVKRAYRRLSVRVHSDAGGTDALFRQVQWAYETLSAGDYKFHEEEDSSTTWERDPRPSTNATTQPRSAIVSTNWVSRHPSWTILIGGLLLTSITSHLSSGLGVIGFLIAVFGLAGITGTKRARAKENLRLANIHLIDQMSGSRFETFLVTLFESEGYGVKHVGGRGDFGADLVMLMGETKTVVQAKRWTGTVGPSAVQEIAAARAHYKAQRSLVVTNSSYTPAARKLAKSNNVELWDRTDLVAIMAKQSTVPVKFGWARYRSELREGLPLLIKRTFLAVFLVFGVIAAASNATSKTRRRRRR